MKKERGKIIIIIASVLIALYLLYPTYTDYNFTKQLTSMVGEDSVKYLEQNELAIREARMKRIKLGLDLQGGMRVVLEVNIPKLLEDLAKNKDETFNTVINEVHAETKVSDQPITGILLRKFEERGIRLSRYYGSIRDNNEEIISKLDEEAVNAIDRAVEVVRNRVDQYGVSEPTIQKQGATRIIVELPGVSKEAEVRQLLQGTALLEFKLLKEPEVVNRVTETIDKYLAGKQIVDTLGQDTAKIAAVKDTNDITIPETATQADADAAKEHPFFFLARPDPQIPGEFFVAEENREKINRMLKRPEIKKLIPTDMIFLWSAKHSLIAEGKKWYKLYPVKKEAELTGGVIVNARATIDPNYNTPVVNMEMNTEGARDWARITGANIQKRIAIVLDNRVFSAPVVRQKIIGGNSQIEGMDNIEEARLLEIVLKAGALPAPVEIIQQQTVGPSLGQDSINKGINSSLLAFVLTVLFMIIYYNKAGTIADFALMFNVVFVLAVLAAFQGTLTLPGIAGMILTMAIAVDSNVLIFERIREEAVTGKTLRAAIDAGYRKAWTAIFDSNLTTFFTGVILYNFGSGPIQGFALTLMIGIAASLFSAIVITRVIFNIMTERNSNISFG
ncbi:MAG: protein translocase subunit SecD [Bacteroidota bacterium]|nr:protein translocase subunit SecD [Bacteroidota bacterium]